MYTIYELERLAKYWFRGDIEQTARNRAEIHCSDRLRLLEKWLEEAEKRIDTLQKANAMWLHECEETRSAVLEELEKWTKEKRGEVQVAGGEKVWLVSVSQLRDKLRTMRET